jgi:hypothetical protein
VELDKLKLEADDSGVVDRDIDTPTLRHCHALCASADQEDAFLKNLQSHSSVFLSQYNPSIVGYDVRV